MRVLMLLALLSVAATLAGCSALGRLSNVSVLHAEQVGAPESRRLVDLGNSGVPTPTLAKTCQSTPAGAEPPIAAVRPGVGTLLHLTQMSVGYRAKEKGRYQNAAPPALGDIDLPLRLVAADDVLEPEERTTLFLFLTTNRAWSLGNAPGAPAADVAAGLAEALERHPGPVWNAFARTLCVEVRPTESLGGRQFVASADMAALCRAVPSSLQPIFAEQLINTGASACPSSPKRVQFLGLVIAPARTGWASAALETDSHVKGSSYYDEAFGGPSNMQTELAFNVVRPFGPVVPDWSLKAWEASGICRGALGESAHISWLRLKGGLFPIGLVDEATGNPTISIVRSGLSVEMHGPSHFYDRPTLSFAALSNLTARDVDQIAWEADVDGHQRQVYPAGCSHR